MDDLDREILKYLQQHGFQSGPSLASNLGKGHRTVQRRLKKMREDGLLRVIAVPNFVALGFKAWAKIGIQVEPTLSSRVAQALVEHPATYFVANSLGSYDIVVAVAFPELERLTRFVHRELTRIEGIKSKETILLVRPIKYYRYLWPGHVFENNADGPEIGTVGAAPAGPVTELDMKIIAILMEDGLTPPETIRRKLGVSESCVRQRTRNLRDSRAITFEVVPNKEVLEDDAWATIGINTGYRFDDKMLDLIVKNQNVYLVSGCLGRFDLVIAARFKSVDLLTGFVGTQLASIPGINAVQTFLHNKPLKYHNIRLGARSPAEPTKGVLR